MLSTNYIADFLNTKQQKIDIKYYNAIKPFERANPCDLKLSEVDTINNGNTYIPKYNKVLQDSFNILFNKSIVDFYYDNKVYKNKSYIFTLFNSILSIGNESFSLYDSVEKENAIKEFIKMIDNDLFNCELYQKFDYSKIHTFNKGDIQEVIKMAYQFKHTDKFNLLKRYISDYLGINLYIISVENDLINYSKSEYYLPNHFGNEINKFLPSMIIIIENEIHKPLMNKTTQTGAHLLEYSNANYTHIIDNIWSHLKIVKPEPIKIISTVGAKYDLQTLMKLKIDNIKKLCTDHDISIQKKSDITMKLINKLKSELIADLLKI